MIEKEGALMSFLNIKTYLINQLSLYSNVTIYDFQMIDEIKNLSLYKDPTHYHPDINHLMLHSFRDQLYIVNETHWNSHEILLSMIREYQIEQQDWL